MAFKVGNKVQVTITISEEALQQIEASKGNMTRTKFLGLTIEELFNTRV